MNNANLIENVSRPKGAGHPWARGLRRFVLWAGEHPMQCALFFFALSVAVRLLSNQLAGGVILTVRPDEYKFLHIAKSIAEGGPLIVRGSLTNYQKILYPLLISPAFLLARDPITQIKLIGVINCLVMSSVTFPVALLVRRLTPKPAVLVLMMAFAVALPEFLFVATIMSEVLYLPLSVWVFYCFHRAMAERDRSRRLRWFALFGCITYLAYLTKEVGAAYLIAGIALLVIEGIRGRHDRRRIKQNALAALVCACVFFAGFLFLKLTLFRNMGNSYDGSQNNWDQIGLSVFKEYPNAFVYMLYSVVTLLLASILSFYILPVFLPLFGLGAMNEEKRRMYLFSAFTLVITVGAMAYTVSIRETLGDEVPRFHMRLLAPIVIPFVILCFDFLLSGDSAKQLRKRQRVRQLILILTAVFCALVMIFLPTIPSRDCLALDHVTLTATYLVIMLVYMGMDVIAANAVWIGFKILMLTMTGAGVLLLLKRKKRTLLTILLSATVVLSIFDNFMNFQITRLSKQPLELQNYLTLRMEEREPGEYLSCFIDTFTGEMLLDPDDLTNAALSVNEFFRQQDDVAGTVILACMSLTALDYIDTYISHYLRIEDIRPDDVRKNYADGIKELWFEDFLSMRGKQVNYVITMEDYNPFTNVEVVYRQPPFLVLKNFDPAGLRFSE